MRLGSLVSRPPLVRQQPAAAKARLAAMPASGANSPSSPCTSPAAAAIHPHIGAVLYSREALAKRTTELGAQLSQEYAHSQPLVLQVMCGAFMFAADLCRAMDVPGLTVDCVRASSYGEGTSSSGSVALSGLTTDVRGRHVLLVEDIVDTGLTIEKLKAHLEGLGAASVRVCTLLNKQSRRKNQMVPEFIGFECPDEFVVGYGLDYAGKYRELPYVGVMRQECI